MSATRPVPVPRPLSRPTPAVRWLDGEIDVPPIASLADFRRWALSDDFPERGRIDYVAGTVEIDMSPKSMYSHGGAEGAILRVLLNRVLGDELGEVHLMTRGEAAFEDVPADADGFRRSAVLGRRYRLDRGRGRRGEPRFDLREEA